MGKNKTFDAPTIPLSIKRAVSKRSYDLLYIHNPEIAFAIEEDIKAGHSPEQIKYATFRLTQSNEFAAKVYAAAIYLSQAADE